MASQKYQKVRFTGKRTGLEQIAIRGHGIVARGDTITVPADRAEQWLGLVRTDEKGNDTSDWAASGDAFSADDEKVTEQIQREREKLSERAAENAPEVETADAFAPASDAAPSEGGSEA